MNMSTNYLRNSFPQVDKMPNIKIFGNPEEVGEYAASYWFKKIEANPRLTMLLSSGKSPIPVYQHMAGLIEKYELNVRGLTAIMQDEYIDLSDETLSYAHYAREYISKPFGMDESQLHFPNGNAFLIQEECRRYESLIQRLGPIDFGLLGIGPEGNVHLGLNERGTDPSIGVHVARLLPQTLAANDYVATTAITVGMPTILNTSEILVIATGFKKARSVKEALTAEISMECPATLLRLRENVTWILDTEAAMLLPRNYCE